MQCLHVLLRTTPREFAENLIREVPDTNLHSWHQALMRTLVAPLCFRCAAACVIDSTDMLNCIQTIFSDTR